MPVAFDFGQLLSNYTNLNFTSVARYDTSTLLLEGFKRDGFGVDLDMLGIVHMLLPASNASQDAIMVCIGQLCLCCCVIWYAAGSFYYILKGGKRNPRKQMCAGCSNPI